MWKRQRKYTYLSSTPTPSTSPHYHTQFFEPQIQYTLVSPLQMHDRVESQFGMK